MAGGLPARGGGTPARAGRRALRAVRTGGGADRGHLRIRELASGHAVQDAVARKVACVIHHISANSSVWIRPRTPCAAAGVAGHAGGTGTTPRAGGGGGPSAARAARAS